MPEPHDSPASEGAEPKRPADRPVQRSSPRVPDGSDPGGGEQGGSARAQEMGNSERDRRDPAEPTLAASELVVTYAEMENSRWESFLSRLPRINYRFVMGLILLATVAGTVVHFTHAFQMERLAGALKRRAERSRAEGDLQLSAHLLRQYVTYVPQDADAFADLATLLNDLAVNPKQKLEALLIMERVLQIDPRRHDIRRTAVRLWLDFGRAGDALTHLQTLKERFPGDARIEFLRGRCHETAGRVEAAVDAYRAAIELSPASLASYRRLADLVPGDAEEVINEMVARNQAAPAAYLARARYRKQRGEVDEAARDVRKLLQLAPDDLEGRLLAAELVCAGSGLLQRETVRRQLERALKEHPREARLYERLFQLEWTSQRREPAMDWLRRGLAKLPDDMGLRGKLVVLLLDRGRHDEVQQEIAPLTRLRKMRPFVNYVEGRLLYDQSKWRNAKTKLLASRNGMPSKAVWAADVNLWLARCDARLCDREAALAAYRRALEIDPRSAAARWELAGTLVGAGRIDEALNWLRPAMDSPKVALAVAELLIQRNLRSPRTRRDWRPVEKALAAAEKTTPTAAELPVLRASLLSGQGDVEQARQVLQRACQENPREVRFWTALARIDWEHGDSARVLETLAAARAELGDHVELRLARIKYWTRQDTGRALAVLPGLEDGLDAFSVNDQLRIRKQLAEAYRLCGRPEQALARWLPVAERQPHDLGTQLRLFELALAADDDVVAQRAIDQQRAIEGAEGPLWQCSQAAWSIRKAAQGDRGQLSEARKLVTELASRGRSLPQLWSNRARLSELEGNLDEALASYLHAFELGDHDATTLERLFGLLGEKHRYDEAAAVLAALETRANPLPGGSWGRLASLVAYKTGNQPHALDLARHNAELRPGDYRAHVWLGLLLDDLGESEQAEKWLRQAVSLEKRRGITWVALVRHLARAGRLPEAAATTEDARRSLPAAEASLPLAYCYEVSGRPRPAEAEYLVALSLRPDDPVVLRNVADFYLRRGNRDKAQPLLRKLVQAEHSVSAADRAWAIRQIRN